VGHHFVRVWALRIAGANAHTSRGSSGWLVHPRRLAPKGGRGARRCAGAGAAACVDDRGWREVDAYHQEMEKTNHPARKGLRRRRLATAASLGWRTDVTGAQLLRVSRT
jgi:hypothetical protein